MNCKPGEMAIRVRAPEDAYIPIGSIVRVIRYIGPAVICARSSMRLVKDAWEVDSKVGGAAIPDSELRPLRDPGDHAIDEMAALAPAPGSEVTA